MGKFDLFPQHQVVGVFRGFREGGLEFHAELVLPYRSEFHSIPMHGQFLLVQLESSDEAVLGRITSLASEGKLTSPSGEDFNIRAVGEHRQIPDDLREQYLRYRVNIRVLGVLRNTGEKLTFVASHRRLPHVGSPVAFASGPVLQEITGHNRLDGAPIGHFALGEYIYAERTDSITPLDWMQFKDPSVVIKFPIESLVSRRSFVFARAGFGKSNLNKLLFSKLYETTPTVAKRGGRQVPIGTIIFDPDGEYFWPDDKGRPGLADVPELRDKLVVFTTRKAPSAYYQSYVAGGIRLDIRRFRPADVISIALGLERQEQQNVRKLASMPPARWEALVNLIAEQGNQADLETVSNLLLLDTRQQEMEALAARSNMTRIVHALHDPASQLMDMLIEALSQGKLCVVDVSQLRGPQSLILSGLILRRIFDRNQEQFTEAEPKTIPTIAVIEEAQSVLNERTTSAEPYIAWVKEGRKYDLGALMITQQPGSIPMDILSQGDNWFIFHLLSAADLVSVRHANAHFSEDILSALLNEPIPGQGVIWSSVGGTPFPVSVRVFSFEEMYALQDPHYNKAAVDTFARALRQKFAGVVTSSRPRRMPLMPAASRNGPARASRATTTPQPATLESADQGEEAGAPVDALAAIEEQAIAGLQTDQALMRRLREHGAPWGMVMKVLFNHIPEHVDGRGDLAYNMVPKAMTRLLGPQDVGWTTQRGPDGRTYVQAIAQTTPGAPNSSDGLPF